MDKSTKRSGYEITAWILLAASVALTVTAICLFLHNRERNPGYAIDPSIWGQFGDLIGGVVGTLVALVSFFLLYATLNEQRNQIQKQGKEIKIQSEDQFFYHLLDRQQNRINSFEIGNTKGYQVFNKLNLQLNIIKDRNYLEIGRESFINLPQGINENLLWEILKHDLETDKNAESLECNKFVNRILDQPIGSRWKFIEGYTNVRHQMSDSLTRVLPKIGQIEFHKMTSGQLRNSYVSMYDQLYNNFDYILDGYFGELEFIAETITKAEKHNLYYDYFYSQITKNEKLIIFYHLLSGKAKTPFWKFIETRKFFNDLYWYHPKENGMFTDKYIDFAMDMLKDIYTEKNL